jgi:ankyrin repeat protein
MTPLCLAAKLGNREIVEFLLQNGAKTNIACTCVYRNKAALHFACENCYADSAQIVELLIDAGANLEQETFDFEKALHFACEFNNPPVVECLVMNGAEINCVNLDGKSPLSLACSRRKNDRSLSIIKYLIDNGADVMNSDGMQNINPIRLLIQNKNMDGVLHLIHKGLLPQDENFLTDAVLTSNPMMVKVLVDHQSNINNTYSLFELTPLHQSCMSPVVSPEIVEILLLNGASPNVKSKTLETPLHYACQKGNVSKVVLLLKFGANINSPNKHGFSPLDACFVKSSCTSDVKLLILKCFVFAGLKVDGALRLKLAKYKSHMDPPEYASIDSQLEAHLRTPLSLLNICRIFIRLMMDLYKQNVRDELCQQLPSSMCDFLQFSDLSFLCEEDKQ